MRLQQNPGAFTKCGLTRLLQFEVVNPQKFRNHLVRDCVGGFIAQMGGEREVTGGSRASGFGHGPGVIEQIQTVGWRKTAYLVLQFPRQWRRVKDAVITVIASIGLDDVLAIAEIHGRGRLIHQQLIGRIGPRHIEQPHRNRP